MKNLIVNADDLGWNDGVNRGIADAFRIGIVNEHPGYADAALKKTAARLQDSRQAELEILADTGARNLIASQGIRLIDYGFVTQEA